MHQRIFLFLIEEDSAKSIEALNLANRDDIFLWNGKEVTVIQALTIFLSFCKFITLFHAD